MEQLDYNLLYRWFVGLSPDDPVWDPEPPMSMSSGGWLREGDLAEID